MRVALAQFNAVVGDLQGNAEKMRQLYTRAVKARAELLIFPELAVCGYPPEDLLHKKHFLKDNRRIVEQLAAGCPDLTMIVGFAEGPGKANYNAAAVMSGGRIQKIYRKTMLPNYGVFDERRYFQPGTSPVVIDIKAVKIAITICFDIWNLGYLSNLLSPVEPFDLLANISASPFHVGKISTREQILARCAQHFGCAVAYCNLVGGQDELVFDGRSMFADSTGRIVLKAAAFEEDFVLAEVIPTIESKVQVDAVIGQPRPPLDPVEEIYRALVLGTRDYVRKNRFRKVLIGLSGGIDSSVTAAIAADALGSENVVGISMPSRFNTAETISDAERLAKNLGIGFHTIPIEPILTQFHQSLSAIEGWNDEGIAYENLQARIRGCILMSLSNQFGSLVLTTGNKSETAVGYATLYGDTAGGFGVIKDVPKTMVYELARYINTTAGREIIPRDVLTRAPSAELRPDQKDTDSLPDYELLDKILKGYVEQDKSAQELIDQGLPEQIVCKVIRMVDRNEYKRRLSPPGVKITPKAFGKDRRLPITNRYTSGAR